MHVKVMLYLLTVLGLLLASACTRQPTLVAPPPPAPYHPATDHPLRRPFTPRASVVYNRGAHLHSGIQGPFPCEPVTRVGSVIWRRQTSKVW